MMGKPFVIIVGGGPSGLLLALLLGKEGIPVQLLESAETLDDRPRATHYGPAAVRELQRAGVFKDMKAKGGFLPTGVCWRKLHGDIIATIPGPKGDEEHPIICLPLNQLNEVFKDHIRRLANVEVLFNHKVVDLGQSDNASWVDVETPEGKKTLEANYVIGCDGANSIVRRSLFGDFNFPGFTWEEQIVATNIYYPFEKHGFNIDSSFIVHPEHWYMAARITTDGMWRVTYGEIPGLTFEELKERQPKKFKAMLPGSPDPEHYRLVGFSPYKVHQRLAEAMRVGRVLLAADAAHLCNPFGGLGLTGGIVDVGGLYDCLYGIYKGYADDGILSLYDQVRREKYTNIINTVSSENIRRLFNQDPELAGDLDEFLNLVKRAETDPSVLQSLNTDAMAIQYDFRKHYHTQPQGTILGQ